METFGERLRREREMRGISLEEIAAATKIGTRSLKALEDQEFNKLPGGIFNKGFVRAYARFLGISEEQAVSDYLAAVGEPENETVEIVAEQLIAQRDLDKKKQISKEGKELASLNDSDRRRFPWIALICLVVIVAAVGVGWNFHVRQRAERVAEVSTQQQQPVPVMPPANVQSPLQPANQQQSAGTATPVSPETQNAAAETLTNGFNLQIRAKQQSWISVTVDGKRVMSGMLAPSDERSFSARQTVLLRTGNAGGVDVALNGKSLAPIGHENEVRTVVFTPDGIQQTN